MSVRKLVTVVVFQILYIAAFAHAQGILSGSKSIGERLDDFNRAIFGGLFSDNKDSQDNKDNTQNNKQAPRPIPGKYDSSKASGDGSGSQNGTIIKPLNTNPQKTTDDTPARAARVYRNDGFAASPGASMPDTRPGGRYFENIKGQDKEETPENSPLLPFPLSGQSRKMAQGKNPGGSGKIPSKAIRFLRLCINAFSNFAIRPSTTSRKEFRSTIRQRMVRYQPR